MNDHHFNIRLAMDYDPETAIFLNNMAFWLNVTAANRQHYFEGRYWLYNSYTQWSEIFPYWSPKQMRRIIYNSIKSDLLMKGCFNPKKYDNTNWYTLTDKALTYFPLIGAQVLNTPAQTGKPPAQTGKPPAQTGRPIPYTNPDTNPVKKLTNCKDPSSSSFLFSKTTDQNLLSQKLDNDPRTAQEFLTECVEHVDNYSHKSFPRLQRANALVKLLIKLKEDGVIFRLKKNEEEEKPKKPTKVHLFTAEEQELMSMVKGRRRLAELSGQDINIFITAEEVDQAELLFAREKAAREKDVAKESKDCQRGLASISTLISSLKPSQGDSLKNYTLGGE